MKSLTQLFVLLLCFVTFPSHAIETITYYHTDSLGSPVAGTDANGALLWKEDYKPYGERIRKQVESEKNTRWYTGHPEDKETGLTYAGARFYDSVTGRFLAIDPVGFKEDNLQMFNRYAYANNNPFSFIDPDGGAPKIPFGNQGNGGKNSTGNPIIKGVLWAAKKALPKNIYKQLFNRKGKIGDDRAKKIFGKREGHVSDTPENRKILEDVANDSKTRLGADKHGTIWSSRIRDDGSQVWTQTRKGEIINGGINKTPKIFNPKTGLSAPKRPNWK